MTVEMIVGPACIAAERRTPERFAENAANHGAGDCAERTGNDQARPRSRRRAQPIGARTWRGQRQGGNNRSRQNKITQALLPTPQRRLIIGHTPF